MNMKKTGRQKNELIMKLQTQVKELTYKVSNLSLQVDEQEQYSRQICLLIHGVEVIKMEILIPYQLTLLMTILG